MKTRLIDIAEVIRSKNAGPYELTFDIIFKDWDMYEKVIASNQINEKLFAKLYNIDKSDIIGIVNFTPAKAIKATIKRKIPSGNIGDRDVYGAQQHAPLLGIMLDL